MGQKASQLKLTDIYQLRNETLFTESEIKEFHRDFLKHHPSGKMTEEDLQKLYKKVFPTGDPKMLVNQIFRIYDTDKNGFIDFREFLCVLSVIANGPSQAKLKLAFELYDQDGSGFISREEYESILMASLLCQGIRKAACALTKNEGAEKNPDRVTFERLDSNSDNKVSFEEFEEYSKRDPTLVGLMKLAGGQ